MSRGLWATRPRPKGKGEATMRRLAVLLMMMVLLSVPGVRAQSPQPLTRKQIMESADKNRDGKISRVEFLERMRDAFFFVDGNKEPIAIKTGSSPWMNSSRASPRILTLPIRTMMGCWRTRKSRPGLPTDPSPYGKSQYGDGLRPRRRGSGFRATLQCINPWLPPLRWHTMYCHAAQCSKPSGSVDAVAQFLAVCRRSKVVSMSTGRHQRGFRLCRR